MRYAVISDIHSNLEALTAFFELADRLKFDEVICLGDIVGYGANPNECIELIRKRNIRSCMGNHDSRAAGLDEPHDFNLHAAQAIYWTRGALTGEGRAYLKGLPRMLSIDNRFLAVHGWLNDMDAYILGIEDAKKNFELLSKAGESNICFFGHTHMPSAYASSEGAVQSVNEETIKVKKGASYLINPGALGQPRDRDPRPSFAVYDTKKLEFAFHRFEYDITTAAEKIVKAGLPQRLAERLKLGW